MNNRNDFTFFACDMPLSIQNEYSPLCRLYDTDLAETAVQEDVTLLGFSPLAAGLLTGKYSGGAVPGGSRASVDKAHGGQGRLGGRLTARAIAARLRSAVPSLLISRR